MNILISIDGSRYTKKMLAYMSTHEEMFGKEHTYTLLTIRPPLTPRVRAAVGADTVNAYNTEEAEKIISPAAKFLLRRGIDAKSSWKVGPVGESISKFATVGKFDLIIMGSRGHGTLGNLVMGSVATQVLSHCEVPVLLIR